MRLGGMCGREIITAIISAVILWAFLLAIAIACAAVDR